MKWANARMRRKIEVMTSPFAAPARFITLEGGEGAGKSTQGRLLCEWLSAQGISVELTREPGGTDGAEDIRNLLVTGAVGRWEPLTETLLHYAARRDHLTRFIKPALAAGKWVVCDRFSDSTIAYQGYGQGISLDTIRRIDASVLEGFTPDLTLILDVSPETRQRRTASRPGAEDRYERMDEAFHLRVREGFQAIAAAAPERCAVIPADGSIDSVSQVIRTLVTSKLDGNERADLRRN
jgi:dTMP kinase